MKKKGGVERGEKKRSHSLLLPESLTTVQNVLLVPAHSRTARLPEQPLPYGVTGASGRCVGALGLEEGGRVGGGFCSGIFPPPPLPHLFIYLHPGMLPNPSHFPWLSHPHFHCQDTTENMFDFFFFLAGTRFLFF